MTEEAITHVSDTSLWVAVHRAQEGKRPDALFQDPLSMVLAGERGERIAASMKSTKMVTWLMALRTVAIDELILSAIASGADTIINLGAGLDTRPYRMKLPDGIRWIEADFQHIIDLKNEKLKSYRPGVHLERVAVDFGKEGVLSRLLTRVAPQANSIVVLTEGLIPYLSNIEVAAMAETLRSEPKVRFWIQDFYQSGILHLLPRLWMRRKMKQVRLKFRTHDWFEFFARLGWNVQNRYYLTELAAKYDRPLPREFPWALVLGFFAFTRRKALRRASGVAMLSPGGAQALH